MKRKIECGKRTGLQFDKLTAEWIGASVGLLMFALPGVVQAQEAFPYRYSVQYGGVTITGYTIYEWLSFAKIPSTIDGLPVTRIGDWAFWSLSLSEPEKGNLIHLFGASIPGSVTDIGNYVFYESIFLESVTIGDGVTRIGDEAFFGCTSLSRIVFGGNAPSLGTNVFAGANKATVYYLPGTSGWGPTFGGRPTVVWDLQHQFDYITNNGSITITKYNGPGRTVTIPDTLNGLPVGSIGDSAFSGWGELTSVTFGNGVTNIGGQAFSGCANLTNFNIPNSVTSIGDYAFSGCASLSRVRIPDGLITVGNHLFADCRRLVVLVISDSVTSIGSDAFSGCSGLTNITMPESVTSIGARAFQGCSGLTSMTLPNGIASIADGTFYFCTSLTNITIPAGVTNIGSAAFNRCARLTNITIPDNVISVGDGAFEYCYNLFDVAIGQSVTSIGDAAFWWCTSLTNITIPDNVISIGDGAFGYCHNMFGVAIGQSVTSIGDSAFAGCTSLTNITIPDGVTNIGNEAFQLCSLSTLTIPDSVFSIGNSAFSYCTNLASVTIGNSVITIGDYAFVYCSKLTNIAIPRNVTNIGIRAFEHCHRLTAITVDPLNPAFSSADGLLYNHNQSTLVEFPAGHVATFYAIPNSVTSIGSWAFLGCTNLLTIMIPDSVANIGNAAFSGCSSLTTVMIPDSVISIGPGAFDDCVGLTNATIGMSVTTIGNFAFAGCRRLTTITFPNGLTNIGDYAFGYCSNLAGVYFQGNAPTLGGPDPFYGDNKTTVYYLVGTTGWGPTFGGLPTALWVEVPNLQQSPQTQTAEEGSVAFLKAQATNSLPLFYWWYRNGNSLASVSTNGNLVLTNVQFSQAGTYTAVISNALGSVTSAPAMLSVIAPVERRPVPGINLMGDAGSLLNLDYTDSHYPAPLWTPLDSVRLVSTSEHYFDLTLPLPAQRFYRASQTAPVSMSPLLNLHMVPALTLTGSPGDQVRVDGINQFGPTNAWFTLATVTLTNTSQLCFDTTAPGQPARLYRLVPVP